MSDDRLKKAMDAGHENRAMQDRAVTEKREISDDDRIAMFRQSMYQSALPDLPKIPGYHVCWLTTSNPRDSIAARARLGYTPVLSEDIPGYEIDSIKTGETAGLIAINEMVAYKVREDLYQAFMRISHHDEPMKEEGKLAETADFIKQQARQQGADVIEGNGTTDLRKSVRAPLAF